MSSWVEIDIATNWSSYQSFQIPADRVDPELQLPGHTSLNLALEELNSQKVNPALGVCIVYSEACQAYYVLYRSDCKTAAYERFGRMEASLPSRMMAAKAVSKERFVLLPLAVLLYRFMEFNAQVLLLTFLTWFIRPSILSVMFVLLWYLPAAQYVGHYGKPIGYPLLNFVVDDFSFLSLHPTPRDASRMYRIAILRVCLMYVLVLLRLIPWPEQIRGVIVAAVAHDAVADSPALMKILNWSKTHGYRVYIAECWVFLAALVALSSFLWMVITLHMLLVRRCAGRPSPILGTRDDAILARVEELAVKIEVAARMEPAQCRQELVRLKEEHPCLQLTSFFNVFGPAWAVLLHIGVDIFNIYAFIDGKDYFRSCLLAFAIFITTCYMTNRTRHGLLSLWHECKESWQRGMFTEDYLAFVRADKGIQAIPALIIIMSGLPFKARGPKQTLGGLGSIAINLALVVPFIMQEFDLGLEREGFRSETSERADAARSLTDTSPGEQASSATSMPMLDTQREGS